MTFPARKTEPETWAPDVPIPIPADFRLASGDVLADGAILARIDGVEGGPVVLALGGISAGRKIAGDDGWWGNIAAPGGAINLDTHALLGLEFAPLSDQRVRIAPDDQARLVEIALDALAIPRLHAFVGASYGAMVGLALAARAPARVARLCVISAAHKPSALGSAWRGVQRRIVEFGLEHNDGERGLALARQLAMTTYRSAEEFESRFGAGVGADGLGGVDAYLIARGEAYPRQMPPRRWLSLSEAIDRHNVDPAKIGVPVIVAACPTDQLAPFADMQALAQKLPRLAGFHAVPSIYGHDAFLKETSAIGAVISRALETNAHV